jgi:hypothetical protein
VNKAPDISPAPRRAAVHRRARRARSALLLVPILGCGAPSLADSDPITQGIDPEANLPFWAYQDDAVEIRLIQRLPDQTRAFFIGRGFTSAMADEVARSCVFQSILRNRGPGVESPEMGIDLGTWRLDAGDGPRPIALKEPWDARFAAAGESDAARIAFRWSTFPTEQSFRGGDYNWGMVSFGVEPGTRFDLTLTWTLNGEPHTAVLEAVTCAPEEADDGATDDAPTAVN